MTQPAPMTGPVITVQFSTPDSVQFTLTFSTQPTEGQIEIAGRELVLVAEILRRMRIEHQLKPQVVTSDVAPSPNSLPRGGAPLIKLGG